MKEGNKDLDAELSDAIIESLNSERTVLQTLEDVARYFGQIGERETIVCGGCGIEYVLARGSRSLSCFCGPNGERVVTYLDPMERLVDGLTVRECLAAYERLQREDHTTHARYVPVSLGGVHLTPNQHAAARLAWSDELKRKQQEAGEKERRSVCVDDDRWEP